MSPWPPRSAVVPALLTLALACFGAPPAIAISSQTLIAPTGQPWGDAFGYSVSDAGDVNGDGYADVIVGARRNDAAFVDAGRAYVYFGGPGADETADLILTGAAGFDYFGSSVSGAGDVNGDGYADVVVGAPVNDAGGPEAGRAYVFYGGPGADETADLILTGAAGFDYFGSSVSGAGDVNGDEYADVMVGAPGNDAGGVDAGRVYVYYGGPGADATADLTLTGAAAGDRFGCSVSGAGDVNGDGDADVIVGADSNDAGGGNAGRAYVYYGGPVPNAVADLTLTGATAGDFFGVSVSGAGDVNSDGYADVIVGASHNDAGGADAGRAYVYYGGPGADAVAELTLTGEAADDNFGVSVSGAGDVNGDGYAEVIVGAYLNDAGAGNAGRAYVYHAGPGADAVAELTLTGEAALDDFGYSVSGAGDVNGDGYADVIVGAYLNDAGGEDAGRAYVTALYPTGVVFKDDFSITPVNPPIPRMVAGHLPQIGGAAWTETGLQAGQVWYHTPGGAWDPGPNTENSSVHSNFNAPYSLSTLGAGEVLHLSAKMTNVASNAAGNPFASTRVELGTSGGRIFLGELDTGGNWGANSDGGSSFSSSLTTGAPSAALLDLYIDPNDAIGDGATFNAVLVVNGTHRIAGTLAGVSTSTSILDVGLVRNLDDEVRWERLLLEHVPAPVETLGAGLPIQVDGDFTDWTGAAPVVPDPAGDAGASGIDFRSIALANDEDRLFLRFDTTVEVKPNSGQAMRIALDTDANPATGSPVGSIGAELVWNLGARTGKLNLGGTSEVIGDEDIGLIIGPTVSGTEFEVSIVRGATNSLNVPLFTSSPLRVAVVDTASGGDQAGSALLYRFAEAPPPPTPLTIRRHPGHIRIAGYNIKDNGLFDPARTAAFDRMLRAVGADVWILNETWSPTTAAQVEARLEALFPGTSWTAIHQGEGVMVATRFPVEEFAFFDVLVRNHIAVRMDLRPQWNTDLLVVGNYWKCCDAPRNGNVPSDDEKRQDQADGLIGSLRSIRAGALMDVPFNTPVIAGGDLNLVGLRRPLQTLLTGDILDTATWGPDSPPDWDGSDFDVVMARHPDERLVYTWRNDFDTFGPGKLDWMVYTGSVLQLQNGFVLDTRSMSADSLSAHGLLAGDTPTASDHGPVVADFMVSSLVAVGEDDLPIQRLPVAGAPNPFFASTTIHFTLAEKADMDLVVFDASGRRVRHLARGPRSAGEHIVTWDGHDDVGRRAPPGVYFGRLRGGNVEQTLRLVLMH